MPEQSRDQIVFDFKEKNPVAWLDLETVLFPFLLEELAELEAADEKLNLDLACWAISLAVIEAANQDHSQLEAGSTIPEDDMFMDLDESESLEDMLESGKAYLEFVTNLIGVENAHLAPSLFEHFLVAALNRIKRRE